MTTKPDYTPDEWQDLINAPVLSGTYIILADMSVTAMPRELKGMYKAILSQKAPQEAKDLVASVVADITEKVAQNKELEEPDYSGQEDPQVKILTALQEVLLVLDAKASREEKAGFCTWLLAVAQATAEAGREGGFLGIGSQQVSGQEKAALAELQQALGLD